MLTASPAQRCYRAAAVGRRAQLGEVCNADYKPARGERNVDRSHQAGPALNPAFAIARARAASTAMSDDPMYLTQLELVLAAMRKAGVPEQ